VTLPGGRALPIWLLAAWVVFLAAETGEHLAHHAGDADGAATCEVLAAATHAPACVAASPALPRPGFALEVPSPAAPECRRALAGTTRTARAPPGSRHPGSLSSFWG